MPDVPLRGDGCKQLPRSLPLTVEARERAERPPACTACAGACWWNGWRVVHPVVLSSAGAPERQEVALPRAKCGVCAVSVTCYPPGFYPRRQYQLDVVAEAVATVEVGGESVAVTAAALSASPRSLLRWRRWIAAIVDVASLHALAVQVDPTSAPVATAAPRSTTAAVLAGFELLGAALERAGISWVERTGVGRVLGWQHRAHGVVLGLVAGATRFSPAMALGGRPSAS